MKISQKVWGKNGQWEYTTKQSSPSNPHLVLVFGIRKLLENHPWVTTIKKSYPQNPIIVFCSTAGEITNIGIEDEVAVVTEIEFNHTEVRAADVSFDGFQDSERAGAELGRKLGPEGLKHVMIFTEGLKINGSSFVRGLQTTIPNSVAVTGGLSGDGMLFKTTLVGIDGQPASGKAVGIGFYGDNINIGFGSLGGWDPFGPERLVTRSRENTLYELDGKPALDLYKEYLGDKAASLPSSGILFPLNLILKNNAGKDVEVTRTLLAVDEKEQSLIFTGDVPEGVSARLMRANFERLIDGAAGAASQSVIPLKNSAPELAILISCIGRKLALKERTIEEIEAVRSVIGTEAVACGFYSYGELCPTAPTEKQCQLHNQTMTITTFKENN